jgi:hypothetical protein
VGFIASGGGGGTESITNHCSTASDVAHPCPRGAITWVIHGPWTEDIEAYSGPRVDVVDEALEELSPVLLTVAHGVLSLAAKDGEELGTRLEEAAPRTQRRGPARTTMGIREWCKHPARTLVGPGNGLPDAPVSHVRQPPPTGVRRHGPGFAMLVAMVSNTDGQGRT